MVRLITLDPGHFHAALVQKTMYPGVDSTVHVYAPDGNDLKLHMDRVDGYNASKDNPTHWRENVYTGDDYFETMLKEKVQHNTNMPFLFRTNILNTSKSRLHFRSEEQSIR